MRIRNSIRRKPIRRYQNSRPVPLTLSNSPSQPRTRVSNRFDSASRRLRTRRNRDSNSRNVHSHQKARRHTTNSNNKLARNHHAHHCTLKTLGTSKHESRTLQTSQTVTTHAPSATSPLQITMTNKHKDSQINRSIPRPHSVIAPIVIATSAKQS